MKVYVLWTGYEDTDGVFSTYEKAKARLDVHFAKYKNQWRTLEDYSIIEETVDEPSNEI